MNTVIKLNAGYYSFKWNALQYPSGVYFYKIVTDGFVEVKKMMLLK
ncbi:MAG: T9SS type A sorting domain-containing protein [Candidatus Marinimicrobia bacterium]|nr:T9SS type A sorting domain-containing protein [Candidatus Neomarinimicrobiota bacterium]